MSTSWETSNVEPSLDDLLSDPIVRLLMQGDRTGESEVRKLIERVRIGLAVTGDDARTVSAPARPARKTTPARPARKTKQPRKSRTA